MRIRDWRSDVCSSDLIPIPDPDHPRRFERELEPFLALAQCRLGAGAFGRIGGLDEDARNLAARVADRLIDEIEQSLLAAVAGEPDGHRMAAIRLAGHKHAVEQSDEALFGHFGTHRSEN